MKTYEEMAQNALDRISNYEAEKKKRRKTIVKIATPALSFCLVAVLCIGVLQSGMFKTEAPLADANVSDEESEQDKTDSKTNDSNNELKPNNGDDERLNTQIITGDSTGQKATISSECLLWWHNKLCMGGALYHAIEDNPKGTIAVLATYRPTTANITSFTYMGKTLAQWAIEADNERNMPEKMMQLLKEGDALKYGNDLYEIGTPSGEKWDKSFYEERIAFYGEELLGKYIVNGVFLCEALEKDIAGYNEQTASKGYKLAYDAYLENVLPKEVSHLSKNGIKCGRADYMNNGLILVITADELENIPLEDLKNWTFDLYSSDIKGISNDETVVAGLQFVN